jgi:carboxyl-terminal processing protease
LKLKKVIYLCVAVALATCVATATFTYYYVTEKNSGGEVRLSDEDYQAIKQFLDVGDLQTLINQYYYKNVDEQTLVNGALKGMVSALDDPYSVYYTEDEYKEYNEKNDGTFVGIGALVSKDADTGYLKVVKVYTGSPAEEQGLKEQDLIVKIDNVDVQGVGADELDDLLKGPVGSAVSLTVLPAETGQEVTMEIVRAELQNQFVFYSMLDDNIAHVTITEFHGDVSKTFEAALQFAQEQNAKGMVLDLRNDLGGSVKECVEIADMILPEGLVCYTLDKDGNRDEYTVDDQYDEIPIVVLVNGDTASASEILAGAIQDDERGVLVGTQTYGKGVVQSILDMPYSGGGVKLTSAVYYTPDGRNINGVGLTPDEVVELPAEVTSGTVSLTRETDTQLARAIEILNEQLGITAEESDESADTQSEE